MASMCVEIKTTRDIGRQILRHRSFSFQEFSGRYAEYTRLADDVEIRLQDHTNRQSSLPADKVTIANGKFTFTEVAHVAFSAYQTLLREGVAKEVARRILPEGMVPTRMYMQGTVRSWIHYLTERTADGVQKEHRLVAFSILEVFKANFPEVHEAVFGLNTVNPNEER